MTDEPHVPMSDPADPSSDPTQPTPTQPPPAPSSWPPPSAWQTPAAWGSAPQGWPPPPAPSALPASPASGYGIPSWGPPPGASRPPTGARRALVAVAVLALALASGGVGAAISAAVHSNSNKTSLAPISGNNGVGNGTNNNGQVGSGNGTPASPDIVAKVNPAVVDIFTTIDTGTSRGEAAGTGMVITSNGEVLTNNHVIDGATKIRVEIVGTGETHTAKVLGYDVVDDVALLKIDNVSGLETVQFADTSTVQIGDQVVAIGNAGGRGGTPMASSGSVTALDQKVTAGDTGTGVSETLHGMIQISAPIEPGDSGGPLVDTDGKVVGMNTAAAQNDSFFGESGSTTAFAIPADKARQVVSQITAGNDSGTVHVGDRAILGVQVRNIPQAGSSVPATSGAAVVGVKSGTPADSAGIGDGDVITSVDGKSIKSASDLTALMFPYHPGDRVDVVWVDQSGQAHHSTLSLVSGPPN